MNLPIIFLIFCVSAVFSASGDTNIQNKCIAESGVDRSIVDGFNRGEDGDEKYKCYAACYLKNSGLMKADGTMNRVGEIFVGDSYNQRSSDGYRFCSEEKGADGCETAYKVFTCIRKKRIEEEYGEEDTDSEFIENFCREKYDVASELVDKFNDGAEVEAPEFKCFAACLMKGFSIMDETEGTIQKDIVKMIISGDELNPEQIMKDLEICFGEINADHCETGYKVMRCLRDKVII